MAHPLDPFPRPTRCPSLALARRKCTWQGQPGRLLPPASGELDARYWVPQSLSGRGVGYRKVCLGVALGTAKFVWAARWVPHKLSPRRACVPEVSPKRSVPRNIKYRGPPGCAMHTPLLPGHSLHNVDGSSRPSSINDYVCTDEICVVAMQVGERSDD